MADVTVPDAELFARYFEQLPDRLQRKVLRQGVQAAGTALAREIRRQVKRLVGVKTGNLRRSITSRAWSVPQRGIIGRVVGPAYGKGKGSHGHLIERGHEIVSNWHKRPIRTGKRTRPRPFQRTAEVIARPQVLKAQRDKLQQAIARERVKQFGRYA